jgi:hypothetical protein
MVSSALHAATHSATTVAHSPGQTARNLLAYATSTWFDINATIRIKGQSRLHRRKPKYGHTLPKSAMYAWQASNGKAVACNLMAGVTYEAVLPPPERIARLSQFLQPVA